MKHKIRTRLVSCIVLLVMTLGMCMPAIAYDQAAAQVYADKWVLSHNPSYRNWISSNADCANFVSQCMQAGGFKEDSKWYYNFLTQSKSWVNADELKNYIKNVNGGTLLGRWQQKTGTNASGATFYGYVDNSANIGGYGSEIVFYDWQGNGSMDHCSIVVGTGIPFDPSNTKNWGDLVDAHTKPRQHQYWHLDQYNNLRSSTQIYCFRLNV